MTRVNGYQILLKICKEENQSGVVSILEKGVLEHNLSEALRDCSVTEFICRCFISTSDFESIARAISKYSEIKQFQEAFEKDRTKKPWLLRGPKNETLLHVATAYGYIKLMKYFVSLDVKVNDVDIDGKTAGHYLGKYSTNIIETTKTLISSGINILHVDKNGMTAANTLAIHDTVNQFHYHIWADHIIKQGHKEVFAQSSKTGLTALHHVMKTIDMGKPTLELLNLDDDINSIDFNGRTILHEALVSWRNLETIQNLIDLGADLSIKDNDQRGVLHLAVEGGNIEVVKYMLLLERYIEEVDNLLETPLHKARFTKSRDYLGMTKCLLDLGANLSAKDMNTNTLAHLFALAENISSEEFQIWVKGMIEDGNGNVFAIRGRNGRTPLQTAMLRLNLEFDTMNLILESSNVDIDQQDDKGSTLLQLAIEFGRSNQTIENLIQLGASTKTKNEDIVLHKAIWNGNIEVILKLISQGLDVNKKNEHGETPLHYVVGTNLKNHFEITKLLLDNGADLYARDKYGNTFAHDMALTSQVNCKDFKIWLFAMIKNGHAPLFTTGNQRKVTPLSLAIKRRNLDLETIKFIIDTFKHNINQPDDCGDTFLHLALSSGRGFDTIKTLLQLGADWKMKDFFGCSVLHCAVEGSNKEAFLYFKSLGADVNGTDRNGKTPLHYVTETRNKDYLGMTKFLLENGANLNAKNNNGDALESLMSSKVSTISEEYQAWKEEMIKLGLLSLTDEEKLQLNRN